MGWNPILRVAWGFAGGSRAEARSSGHACNDLTPNAPSLLAVIACAAAWLAASVVK